MRYILTAVLAGFMAGCTQAPELDYAFNEYMRDPPAGVLAAFSEDFGCMYGCDSTPGLDPAQKGYLAFNEYMRDPRIDIVTAYSSDCGGSIDVKKWCDGLTATYTPARHGVCAASWSMLPPGTRLYINGYGECVVEDTGGAMRQAGKKGLTHVDVFMETKEEAFEFGRREGFG